MTHNDNSPNNIYQESVFSNGMYEFKGLVQSAESSHSRDSTQPHDDIVLCLHGWLDNAASFIPLFPHLTHHNVIAIDLIGHGYSPHRSEDAYYHFFDWVDDIFRLINAQSWKRIHIVGHSMGGMIACGLAAFLGQRIASITLLDVLGFVCCDAENTTKQLQKGLLSRQAVSSQKRCLYQSIEQAIRVRMHMNDLTQNSAALLVERGMKNTVNGYVWRADPRLNYISPYRLTHPQAIQLLNDIQCPVQLLYADKGYLSDGKTVTQFIDSIKKSNVVKFSGKHHFHMDQAEKTAMYINNFIKSTL